MLHKSNYHNDIDLAALHVFGLSALNYSIAGTIFVQLQKRCSLAAKIERTKYKKVKRLIFSGAHVGFTVKNQKDNTDPRIFRTVVYNSEPGFNTANGKFVCHHSGMYLFTATVIRSSGTAEVYCWINVNGSDNVLAIASDYRGHHSGSATLVVHLNVGDEVYLAKCKGNMDTSTSFSGALIKPDPN